MKKLVLTLLLLVTASAYAQTGIQTVDVKANNTDIRDVLYQLFTQAKKSYVLQPGIRESLNLNLVNVEFEEALQIVCEAASLRAELQNGIYYVGRKGVPKPVKLSAPPTGDATAKAGELDPSVLNRKVSAKMMKAPIKLVLAELARQTHLKFELDPHVPSYKMDAVLPKMTLKQALDRITKATKLEYEFTSRRSIRIRPAQDLVERKI